MEFCRGADISNGDKIFWLPSAPASLQERRLSLAVMGIFLVVCAALAPFAARPLPQIAGFIPANEGMIFVVALVTAVFLFTQFRVTGSRALLVLASGYLFSALIVIPHALTFPGSFSPIDLLAAGAQAASWLYVVWHFGFFSSTVCYALLKEKRLAGDAIHSNSSMRSIYWSVVIVIGLACALTSLILLFDEWLPPLIVSEATYSPLVRLAGGLNITIGLIALALLWTRGTVLDQWLMVAVFSLIAEVALVSFFVSARFNLGFYSGHVFAVVSSTVVLIALLSEATGLYGRFVRTFKTIQRERDSKLLSLEAVAAAIAHEVNQPITAVAWDAETALTLLKHKPPDLEQIGESLDSIVGNAHRGAAILREIRDLFARDSRKMQAVDVNAIVKEAVSIISGELKAHDVTAQMQLTVLPSIMGHGGQLEQVILNLLRNAVEALCSVTDRPRVLRIQTERLADDKVSIVVEDTGPGVDPQLPGKIFETFVTTKPSGMGLGLYLSRMIIQRHGGDISVSSTGVGAQFRIVLPLRP